MWAYPECHGAAFTQDLGRLWLDFLIIGPNVQPELKNQNTSVNRTQKKIVDGNTYPPDICIPITSAPEFQRTYIARLYYHHPP